MINTFTCFWLGCILVGLCIFIFDSLLMGFIIGELLGIILVTLDMILDAKKKDDGVKNGD